MVSFDIVTTILSVYVLYCRREKSGSDKLFVTYFLWNAIIIGFNPEDVKVPIIAYDVLLYCDPCSY